MAVSSSSNDLIAALPLKWQWLLQGWSASGRLTAAADEALLLTRELEAKKDLVTQWSLGDIKGVMETCAVSTVRSSLNYERLESATRSQIFAVLAQDRWLNLNGISNGIDAAGDHEAFADIEPKRYADHVMQGNGNKQSGPVVEAGLPGPGGADLFSMQSSALQPIGQAAYASLMPIQSKVSRSYGLLPGLDAVIHTNDSFHPLGGRIGGTDKDDVFKGVSGPHSENLDHATIKDLEVVDVIGNVFVSAEGPITNNGPNWAIGSSIFNLGDGYVRIDARIYQGNYNYAFTNNVVSMGAGDSDINVTIEQGVYWDQLGFVSSVVAGGGDDSINVNVSSTFMGTIMCAISSSDIDLGEGSDSLTAVCRRIPGNNQGGTITGIKDSFVRTGGGCDYVAIESSDYEGLDDVASKDTYFSLGADNDVVEILGYRYGLYYSVLSDVPKVLLGSGNDRLVIKSTDGVAIENAFVDGGDGDDEVAIEGLFANSVIDLGMGYDILAISGQMNDYQLDGRFLFMKADPDRRLKGTSKNQQST